MLSNQHRLLGGDTRHGTLPYCRSDRMHGGVGKVAGSIDAGHTGFAAFVDLESNALGRIDRGEAQRFMQACRRLVTWMREQNVDCNRGGDIEPDGGVMASIMVNFGDPPIDDGNAAVRQIRPDIGWDVMTIGKDRQRVGPVVVQPDVVV